MTDATLSSKMPKAHLETQGPTLQEVRIAFRSTQYALRKLQGYPVSLLNLATFRYADAEGHASIDEAIALLEREVATLKSIVQTHRASRSNLTPLIKE